MNAGSSVCSLPQSLHLSLLSEKKLLEPSDSITWRRLESLTDRLPKHSGHTEISLLLMKNIQFFIETSFVMWYHNHVLWGTSLRWSILQERNRNEVFSISPRYLCIVILPLVSYRISLDKTSGQYLLIMDAVINLFEVNLCGQKHYWFKDSWEYRCYHWIWFIC